MKLIFWGLFFLLFDFELNFGSSTVSILPTFVGYAMIFVGMGRVAECEAYARTRSWAAAGIVFSAVVWLLNCLGVSYAVLVIVFTIIGTVLQLFVTYEIAKGIRELEGIHGYDMYGKSLMSAWIVLLVWRILTQVTIMPMFAMIAMLASLIFTIYYIVRFHKSRKAYAECISMEASSD